MIAVAAWIAKQERMRISDRVRAGLERARKNGTKTGQPIGRPRAVFDREQIVALRAQNVSWPEIAQKVGASVRTIRRVWDAGEDSGPISDDATGTAA
jgi:DNA invertase Pin-like site-specific DNA recombinase